MTWIENGLLQQLAYDRYTAYQKGIALIPTLEFPCLEGEPRDQCTLEQLIQGTKQGIFVTNFFVDSLDQPNGFNLDREDLRWNISYRKREGDGSLAKFPFSSQSHAGLSKHQRLYRSTKSYISRE